MGEDSRRPARRDQPAWLNRPLVVLPLLVLLALVTRLPNLGESLWFDEVKYSTRYESPDLSQLWGFIKRVPGGPMYLVMGYGWSGLVGENEIAVRIPSMLFGLGSTVLTWILARRFGGPATALVAALALCLSPTHIWYSQEAAPYAMTMFFTLGAVAAWPYAAAGLSRTWTAVYAGALLTACLTHFFAAAFLAPLSLFAWTVPREGRRRILVANTAVLLVLLSVLVLKSLFGRLPSGLGFLRPFTLFEWWMLLFHWCLHGNTLWTALPHRATSAFLRREPLLLAVQIAAAVLVVRGLVRYRPGTPGAPRWLPAACLIVLPLTMWVLTLAGFRSMYTERYLLVVLPFFAIALALGATGYANRFAGAAFGAAVVLLTAASYEAYLAKDGDWTVYKQNPDWLSAADHMRGQQYDLDRSIFFTTIPIDDFEFYLRKHLPYRMSYMTEFSERRFDRALAENVNRVVVVKNRFWLGGVDRVLAQIRKDPRVRWRGYQAFKGVELYEFVPVDPARQP